jgi:hypothetical protein
LCQHENCSLLGYGTMNMGPMGCPATSVRNRRFSLRNNPEERNYHLLRGRSLHSRIAPACFNSLASFTNIKQLSVVAFRPSFTYGSVRRITAYLPCSSCACPCSSYPTIETPLANTLTLHQLQAKILFQIYQVYSPYTEQSNTMS